MSKRMSLFLANAIYLIASAAFTPCAFAQGTIQTYGDSDISQAAKGKVKTLEGERPSFQNTVVALRLSGRLAEYTQDLFYQLGVRRFSQIPLAQDREAGPAQPTVRRGIGGFRQGYEITVAQQSREEAQKDPDPCSLKSEDQPVICVSITNAVNVGEENAYFGGSAFQRGGGFSNNRSQQGQLLEESVVIDLRQPSKGLYKSLGVCTRTGLSGTYNSYFTNFDSNFGGWANVSGRSSADSVLADEARMCIDQLLKSGKHRGWHTWAKATVAEQGQYQALTSD